MKKTNKVLSWLLVFAMVLGIFPFDARANDSEANSVTILFRAQKDGAFLFNQQEITVTDGLAEEYGYTVAAEDHNKEAVGGPTVFDALVAVHKAKYGDDFTKETAGDYLQISSGTLTRAFGQSATSTGYFVNGEMPNDGIAGDHGTTGYMIDTAVLASNDNVDFWFYQDNYWTDYYTFFTETEKTVSAGESFTLTLEGFMALSAMGYEPEAEAINGEDGYITIHSVKPDGSLSEALTDADGEALLIDANGQVTLSFEEAGTYLITANGMEGDFYAPIIAPWCEVTVEPAQQQTAPSEITIVCEDRRAVNATRILAKTGDTFQFKAYDQDGNETPVTWSTTSYAGSIDAESGIFTTTASLSSGVSSSAAIAATSTLDENVSKKTTFWLEGYLFSEPQKTPSVALSIDGQTAKTVTVTGGYTGYTNWSYQGIEGIAKLAEGQDFSTKKNSIQFQALRPGSFDVTFTLDLDETMTDTATVTITGVAVEDAEGNQMKTYLSKSAEEPNPTVQLTAYVEEGRTVASWSSADESIATVDENGVVTAQGVGSVIITAADSEGGQGGIKVVVQDAVIPYFESIEFLSSAIKDYNKVYHFAPATTEYALEFSRYNTSILTLQNTTLYDTDKYTATAEYTDINGEKQTVAVNSGALTYLRDIPFDESIVTITLANKTNPDNKTVYTFTITRPRDGTKTIKGSTGIVLVPEGRDLSSAKYNGQAEGTMFRADEEGNLTSGTGVSATQYFYRCFTLDGLEAFSLKLAGTTVYEHLRYSADEGKTWTELPQGGGTTDQLKFQDGTAKVQVQVIDDKTYLENVKAGRNGFDGGTPNTYTVWVEQTAAKAADAQILTANVDGGDWYPSFTSDHYSYTIVVPEGITAGTLTYTAAEGATVKLGQAQQAPDQNGVYTLELKTSTQTLTVTSADGNLSSSYSFVLQPQKAGYPDKVVDYLCINSQYTNGTAIAASPWKSLTGTAASIGGFGGYITYYYEDGLTDDPKNKYGMDFYVYGNAMRDTSTSTKTSFFEPAQVWVSEDGEEWYALAGSAHYEDGADWDYSVTYTKTDSGKTAWTDCYGNSSDGSSYTGAYPSASVYYMNDLAKSDSLSLSGVMLPARSGDAAVSGIATDAYPISWGYADCFPNGTIGADVNPYLDNSSYDSNPNGFDLAWAVDEQGNPIDVSDKEFHYVKLQTVSNIWHPGFGEKSPEIAGVVRTTPQSESVGKTTAPTGVTITDGADTKKIIFTEDQQVYSVDLGDMKYVSLSLDGAAETDNIYVNNQRIAYNETADGFKVTKEAGAKLVRIVVQNGDREPVIYLLKLTSEATETEELIEGVKIDVSGSTRTAETKDGKVYTASVGYRIDSIGIMPVADSDVAISINGSAAESEYALAEGLNVFTITGEKDGITHTITLEVTKEFAPESTGTIRVYFSLLGDDIHGDNGEIHTLQGGGLTTWIPRSAYEIDAPATVLDVLEKALDGKYTYINADGNYISKIGNLGEFDNGPNSGWLYTINGSYSNKGVAEQSIQNGDVIVFHYTDDYTKEQGAENWPGGDGSDADKYTVEFNSNGGTAVESQSVEKNGTVQKPEDPKKEGYVFDGWYIDKELTKPYDFSEKVTAGFTLYAKWKERDSAAELPFKDVMEDAWYFDAVEYAYENGLMSGISASEFDPNGTLSRAMMVSILYRMAGEPESDDENVFGDVAADTWYTEAVIWASENGIVSGYGDGNFGPNDAITREQFASILYRCEGSPEVTGSDLDEFTDGSTISAYAQKAVLWAVQNGILSGRGDGSIDPANSATRAETASIFQRYLENKAQ